MDRYRMECVQFYIWFMKPFGQNSIETDFIWCIQTSLLIKVYHFFSFEWKKGFEYIFFQFKKIKYAEVYFEQQEFIVRMNPVDIFQVLSTATVAVQALQIHSGTDILWYFLTHFFSIQLKKKKLKRKIKYSQWNKNENSQQRRNRKEKKQKSSDFSNVHIPNFLCSIQIILNKYLHFIQCSMKNGSHTHRSKPPTRTNNNQRYSHAHTYISVKNASQIESA